MAKNWLRITHQDNTIQLSWQRGLSAPRSAPPVTFEHPFDEETLTDLRWYLEKFLPFPYGIFPDKAKKIEQKFQEWGQRLFELVFPRSTKAWDFFCEATREGLDKCEINISSDDPTVLNLPWELVYSPDYQFLAPSLAGMYRSLSGHAVRAEMGQLPQDKLNILLVIARPYGEKDVALKTIARPLLEALKPIQKYVNLKVLRPPSFEEFERELNAHKGFYHIVHFDGHGNFDADSAGFQYSFGSKGQGVLVFENIDGSPQIITATQIAQSLNDCRVPIFVLNACKSAQEGDGSFSSVATRLVSLGAKGVVAMAYNVQVEAAKHFIGRFYQQLVAGTDVSTAVAAARRQVLNQRLRPSPKGDLPLADWMVPILYQQETCTPFVPTSNSTENILDIDNFLEEPVSNLVGFPEQGRYGFIGRDYDILRLDRAFRQNNVVLLQGMGGVGKTELTAGFARWLEETQGREKIFFTSFESGASLSRVVNEVGRAVWGDKFSQYAAEQQQRAVLKYLQSQPCLLIWDNFEPVAGFPEGNEPLLSGDERDDLKQFLKELRGGKTWVLITSRCEEAWLDCGYSLINLQGLSLVDAQEFAAKILQSVGVERKNLPEEYLDLLKLLGGHPLSLRVVLPYLKTQTPMQVIEALCKGDNLEKKTEEGRDNSLIASLNYSFARLSEKARRHLLFLAFFSERVDVNVLYAFSGDPRNAELKLMYQGVFNENLEKADWLELFDEAAKAGIVEHLSAISETNYKISPTLPWYLLQKLKLSTSQETINALKKKLLHLYVEITRLCNRHLIDNAELATTAFLIEEPNILQNLRFAEQQQEWSYISSILKPLGDIYLRLGRIIEFNSLRNRVLKKVGVISVEAKAKSQEAFDLWISLRTDDGNEATRKDDWKTAGVIFQEILDDLTSSDDLLMYADDIAACYYNLGYVAENQNLFEEAANFYHQALSFWEEKGEEYKIAYVYHQLGNVERKYHKQFNKAEDYYHKALRIFKKLGDWYNAAGEYHNLGILSDEQEKLEEAKRYYQQALKEFARFHDNFNMAKIYNQLGLLAQKENEFEEAITNFQKAMKIYEDMGYINKAADELQNLGNISQELSKFEEANLYYKKALEFYKKSGNLSSTAIQYYHLGVVSEKQKQLDTAIYYYKKALHIHENYEYLNIADRVYHNLGEIAYKLKQLDSARDYYQKALQIYERSKDSYKINEINYQLAIVAQDKKQFEVAIFHLIKVSKTVCFSIGDWDNPINKIGKLGEIFNTLGEKKFEAVWLKITGEELTPEWRFEVSSAAQKILQRERANVFLFDLGQIVWTPGAMQAFESNKTKPDEYLRRHITGDWGNCGNYYDIELTEEEYEEGAAATDDQGRLNCRGVTHFERILSSYNLSDGTEIWITTEPDKSHTTILLPSEY